jgi:hypothetical protein
MTPAGRTAARADRATTPRQPDHAAVIRQSVRGAAAADPADVATQNDPICARQLTIAEKPPLAQKSGY